MGKQEARGNAVRPSRGRFRDLLTHSQRADLILSFGAFSYPMSDSTMTVGCHPLRLHNRSIIMAVFG